MSIEIEIVTGDAGWPAAKPLLTAIWPPGGPIEWAHPARRNRCRIRPAAHP